ncbi:MAG: hypothetical protein ACPGQM_02840 [Alphaproteobacteria bacterium]
MCYGTPSVVWRYDPVVITDATPIGRHVIYCYSVGNPDKARQHHRDHDPDAAMLGLKSNPEPTEKLTA